MTLDWLVEFVGSTHERLGRASTVGEAKEICYDHCSTRKDWCNTSDIEWSQPENSLWIGKPVFDGCTGEYTLRHARIEAVENLKQGLEIVENAH